MTKFKAGDVVVYLDDTSSPGQVTLGVPKVVKSVSPCGKYLRVLRDDNGEIGGYYATDFALIQEQDDPLPPAPESVLYNDEYPDRSAYSQPWLAVKQKINRVYIETGQYDEYNGVGMELSPDAVLQLAHDLTRMAMEIKRRERTQSGE